MERSFLRFRLKVSLREDMPFPVRHFTQQEFQTIKRKKARPRNLKHRCKKVRKNRK